MGELFELASKLGGAPLATVLIFMLSIIVITGKRGDWRWKREIDEKDVLIAELKQDRDEWKGLALDARLVARDAVDLAKHRRS